MRKELTVVIFLLSTYLFTHHAYAHQVNKSGTIETSIHISPNDHPIAQQLSRIEIEVIDINKQFDFGNCLCTLQISNSTATTAELTIDGYGSLAETSYTFAADGEYTLIFKGENLENKNPTFEPFELSYNYTVEPSTEAIVPIESPMQSDTNSSFNTATGIVILSLLVIASVLVLITKKINVKR